MILWVAYCLNCEEEIDKAPNGMMVEGAARYHRKHSGDNFPHEVIVGYYVGDKENE